MSKYSLLLSSKNKTSLNNFLNFCTKTLKQDFQIFTKLSAKKKIKEKISVLKSPHVNKTAQEQFKYVHFYMSIASDNPEIKKEFFILKKIKNQLFSDLKIIIKGHYSKKKDLFNLRKKTFHNKKFPITHQTRWKFQKNKNPLKKTIFYLKTLDYNGKRSVIKKFG